MIRSPERKGCGSWELQRARREGTPEVMLVPASMFALFRNCVYV